MKSVKEIFLELFPDAGPVEVMKYQETSGWDSLAHMQLCSRLEENFDIMLEISDIAEISSFTIAKEIMLRYNVAAK